MKVVTDSRGNRKEAKNEGIPLLELQPITGKRRHQGRTENQMSQV
jgi:hypothetical protein